MKLQSYARSNLDNNEVQCMQISIGTLKYQCDLLLVSEGLDKRTEPDRHNWNINDCQMTVVSDILAQFYY